MKPAVIIVGGTKGLGRELSLSWARSGAKVLAVYHKDESAAHSLMREFELRKLDGGFKKHDITESPVVVPEWTEISSVTVVHAAAVSFVPQALHTLTWADFSAQFDVSMKGAFHSALTLLSFLKKKIPLTFVPVLSEAVSIDPPAGFSAHASAKAALAQFAQSLSVEYGTKGVRVVSVAPAFMDSALTQRWPEATRQKLMALGSSDTSTTAKWIIELCSRTDLPGEGEIYRQKEAALYGEAAPLSQHR